MFKMILIQSPQEATPLYFPQKRLLYIKVQIYKLFLMRRQQSYREAMQRRAKRMRQSIPDFLFCLKHFFAIFAAHYAVSTKLR